MVYQPPPQSVVSCDVRPNFSGRRALHHPVESLSTTASQGLEGTSRDHWVQPPAKAVPYKGLHRLASRWVLNISIEGDSTTSLGSLFLCSVSLTVKMFFHMFVWHFLCSSFRLLLLVLSLHTTEKSLASSTCLPSPFRYLQTFIRTPDHVSHDTYGLTRNLKKVLQDSQVALEDL